MSHPFHYNLDLPDDLGSILEQDFWILNKVFPLMFQSLSEPVKFAAHTWIYVRKGFCRGEINLISHDIKAPALVVINSSQIMQPTFISEDFEAAVIVMSRRFQENLMLLLANTSLYTMVSRHAHVSIPEDVNTEMEKFLTNLEQIAHNTSNPYLWQALVFEVASFIYKSLYKCYEPFKEGILSVQGRLSTRFIALVQDNYKKERFLDFYARKLEITPKHLSRTIKNQTGYTAVEWIERFVTLEAKVLLKSTNLNIQQIADELNFPTQSFFGKYFKKCTGMSPTEFRNS